MLQQDELASQLVGGRVDEAGGWGGWMRLVGGEGG